ncbi:MAG: hypothetical protein AB2375_08685 [Tissierellaceae bacterium]
MRSYRFSLYLIEIDSMNMNCSGKQGSKEGIPILIKEYLDLEREYSKEICYENALLIKMHVMDAIERIKYHNLI